MGEYSIDNPLDSKRISLLVMKMVVTMWGSLVTYSTNLMAMCLARMMEECLVGKILHHSVVKMSRE